MAEDFWFGLRFLRMTVAALNSLGSQRVCPHWDLLGIYWDLLGMPFLVAPPMEAVHPVETLDGLLCCGTTSAWKPWLALCWPHFSSKPKSNSLPSFESLEIVGGASYGLPVLVPTVDIVLNCFKLFEPFVCFLRFYIFINCPRRLCCLPPTLISV